MVKNKKIKNFNTVYLAYNKNLQFLVEVVHI